MNANERIRREHDLPVDAHGLIRFESIRELGRQSELSAALKAGTVTRLRRGVYREVPDAGRDRGRRAAKTSAAEQARLDYVTMVRAAALSLRAPVFTSYSAAALHGLPIVGRWPEEVYVMSRDAHGSRRRGVVTVARTRETPITFVDGCAVTSVEFTLLQLARHAPLLDALAAADAALHVPRFGHVTPMTTCGRLLAEHERLKPYPGSRRADAVLRRATHLADSPLETGSRLLIEELGFATPTLQHELWLPELGRRAFLDFYWPEVDVGAEADGRGKYRGEASARVSLDTGTNRVLSARDAAEAAAFRAAETVIAEKDRENAIRRQVRGFDRWDWIEFRRKHPVERRLEALGVPRVRRRTLLIT